MEASKKMIYVGGLADEVDSKVLNAAFIPFGDIVEVNLPIDYETEKHRGFAFIEFELAEDASAAIDNMNDGEMFGRQLRVKVGALCSPELPLCKGSQDLAVLRPHRETR